MLLMHSCSMTYNRNNGSNLRVRRRGPLKHPLLPAHALSRIESRPEPSEALKDRVPFRSNDILAASLQDDKAPEREFDSDDSASDVLSEVDSESNMEAEHNEEDFEMRDLESPSVTPSIHPVAWAYVPDHMFNRQRQCLQSRFKLTTYMVSIEKPSAALPEPAKIPSEF